MELTFTEIAEFDSSYGETLAEVNNSNFLIGKQEDSALQ